MKNCFYACFKILVALCALAGGGPVSAQVLRPFSIRYQTNARGKIVLVSNNIITSKGTGVDYTALPPNCGTATAGNCRNDAFQGTPIDIDGDPATLNSSSAQLALPACNTVAFAGLYWGVGIAKSQGSNGINPLTVANQNLVKLKAPGGAYQTVSASVFDSINTVFQGYQAFADVTALVQNGGGGSYTVADVKCDTNKVNTYGGWTLVVVVRDSTLPVRNLTVFDGIAVIGTSGTAVNATQFNVSGFKTPPSGPVNCLIGAVCYDGDRGPADSFRVRQNSNSVFVNQTDAGESANATSSANDAWNSSITALGSTVTTRTPAHANTYGYDADLFQLNNTTKNYLGNSDSSLTIRIGSPSEGYVLGLVTTQIDAFSPELILQTSTTDVNGGTYNLGDTLAIANRLRNTGSDTALNARIAEKLPDYFKYVANSIKINGVAKTDAAGDDEAEYNAATRTITSRVGGGATAATGGKVRSNGTDNFTTSYQLALSNNCADVGITPVNLLRQNQVFFQGTLSTTPDTAVSRPAAAGSPCVAAPAPDTARLLTGCPAAPLSAARLLSFTHRFTESGSTLHWRVREEEQMQAYRIERGGPGEAFATLEEFSVNPAAGIREYHYTDGAGASAGERWYRVWGREISGQWWTGPVVVVKANRQRTAPVVAPNPGTNTLQVASLNGGETLRVYSMQGQLLLQEMVPDNAATAAVSTAALQPGLYLVQVQGQAATYHLRWVKE